MHATIQKPIEEIMSSIRVFVENAARLGRPVQLGVVVLKSPQMGADMNRNVSGISVPQAWIDEIGAVAKGGRKQKAAAMTSRQDAAPTGEKQPGRSTVQRNR
jgi:hypothetical protein